SVDVGCGDSRVLVVIHVDAVEHDVVLIFFRTENLACWRNARLHAQQLDDVAGLQGDIADLRFGERIADCGILRVDGCGLGGCVDRLAGLAYFHGDVQSRGHAHLQADLRLVCRESRLRDVDLVYARWNLRKAVLSGLIRDSSAGRRRLRVGDGDDGGWDR